MRRNVIILFFIFLISMFSYSQFRSAEEIDKLSDEVKISFYVFSKEWGDLDEKAGLYLTTSKHHISLGIDFENMDYMNSKHVFQYRFNKEPMDKLDARGNKTESHLFIVIPKSNNKQFKTFFDNLMRYQTLTVRVITFTGNTCTYTFDITGLKNEIDSRNIDGTVLKEYIDK